MMMMMIGLDIKPPPPPLIMELRPWPILNTYTRVKILLNCSTK